MPKHTCCACFTHNNLPCCNEGHKDWAGVQRIRKAWERSPLLRSVRDHRTRAEHDVALRRDDPECGT